LSGLTGLSQVQGILPACGRQARIFGDVVKLRWKKPQQNNEEIGQMPFAGRALPDQKRQSRKSYLYKTINTVFPRCRALGVFSKKRWMN